MLSPQGWQRLLILCAPGVIALGIMGLSGQASWPHLGMGLAIYLACLVLLHASSLMGRTRKRKSIKETRRQLDKRHLSRAMKHVLASVPDPAMMLDDRHVIQVANQAAAKLFDSGLQGRELFQIVRDPDLLDAIERARHDQVERLDVNWLLPSAPERHFQVHLSKLRMDDPRNEQTMLLFRERTTEVAMDRVRADFVANVSHELRTPLTSLIGFIETLRGPASSDPEARQPFLAIMEREAARMSRLIEDLLTLSTIEMQVEKVPTDQVDVVQIAQDVISALETTAEKRQVQIDLKVPDKSVLIIGDHDQMVQMATNLIDNAIKYNREGGKLTVELGLHHAAPVDAAELYRKPALAFAVSDQGEGIPPEYLLRLTERFFRVDKARSQAIGGTGLGLSIIKHILKRHRGHLDIRSVPGEGSCFTAWLPLPSADDALSRHRP